MVSFMSLLCFATSFALVIATPVASEEFKVGGDEGWRQPATNETEMYANWATTFRFHIGDSLRFEYKKDTVVVVDKWGYYHCNSSHAAQVFNNGNTVVRLERPGPVYFISANSEHCRNGQRLTVEAMALHPISETPPRDASPAPSPSGAVSLSVGPGLVYFCYALLLIAASINM